MTITRTQVRPFRVSDPMFTVECNASKYANTALITWGFNFNVMDRTTLFQKNVELKLFFCLHKKVSCPGEAIKLFSIERSNSYVSLLWVGINFYTLRVYTQISSLIGLAHGQSYTESETHSFASVMVLSMCPVEIPSAKTVKGLEPFVKAMYRKAGTVLFCAHFTYFKWL